MRTALMVLKDCVEGISSGNGRNRDCLKKAMGDFCKLKVSQFPPELQQDFLMLQDSVGYDRRSGWRADLDKLREVRRNIDRLRSGECIRITYSLIKLENSLEHFLDGKK